MEGRAEKAITAARLSPFYSHSSQPKWEALAKYALNIAICEAFYPLLNHIEIVLRNTLDQAISRVYFAHNCPTVAGSWLDAQPSHLNSHGQDDVDKAKARLSDSPTLRGVIGHGHLVAELDFGFWTGLLSGDYNYRNQSDQRLWPRLLSTAFPRAPQQFMKSVSPIANAFNDVRRFRNRVFHHESVLKLPVADQRTRILELIAWVSPETSKVVGRLDRVEETLSDRFRRMLRIRTYRELSL